VMCMCVSVLGGGLGKEGAAYASRKQAGFKRNALQQAWPSQPPRHRQPLAQCARHNKGALQQGGRTLEATPSVSTPSASRCA
jgi:hypothetical protein